MTDLVRDMSLPDLQQHLDQWWKDRAHNTQAIDLNNHQHLMIVVADLNQDTRELFCILMGVLDRLNETEATGDGSDIDSWPNAKLPRKLGKL